tara:strand:+ start:347 stop:517 length:171 start_codon:yes stop_codon:yes gene_type:complete
MSTKEIVGSAFDTVSEQFAIFKDRYCPDGQTCQDLATLGSLVFIVWFMYIAMEPIM